MKKKKSSSKLVHSQKSSDLKKKKAVSISDLLKKVKKTNYIDQEHTDCDGYSSCSCSC